MYVLRGVSEVYKSPLLGFMYVCFGGPPVMLITHTL